MIALGAIVASMYALIHDLGRPARFHHMLRVAKPTSPMSVGTWILSLYGPFNGLAAVGEFADLLPPHPAGTAGPAADVRDPSRRDPGRGHRAAVASYTAVLLTDTATPSWHEAKRELPFVFVGSAAAAAAGRAC